MARGFRGFRREPSSGKKMCDVLYWVDVNVGYHESVKVGDSVLNPTTFTPTKSGYTFLGWKDSGIASADVFTDKTAEGTSMILYAVFIKTITVTYRNHTVTSTATGTQYYNNSDTLNPSFTLTQTPISAWIARGWTTSASGGASAITYANGATFTRSSNITLYGCYYRTVTVSYNGNGATSGSTAASTGTAYYHSASGGTNAAISIRANGFVRTNYGFVRWRLNSTSGTAYSAGSTYTSVSDATMYAEWIYTAAYTFNYTGGMQSFTALAGVTYQIQVYGAQGGTPVSNKPGGYGGYSIGYRRPTSNETWYIGVGGQGSSYSGGGGGGGWNGGGSVSHSSGNTKASSGGGGCSHIALAQSTVLSGTNAGNVIIVAGGGGGNVDTWSGIIPTAGSGGGTNGGSGNGIDISGSLEGYLSGTGGTQSSAGTASATSAGAGGYGYGGSSSDGSEYRASAGGGGGGWYGGGAGVVNDYSCNRSGGGGSGNTRGTYSAGMSNGQKTGNGQVIIKVYSY